MCLQQVSIFCRCLVGGLHARACRLSAKEFFFLMFQYVFSLLDIGSQLDPELCINTFDSMFD